MLRDELVKIALQWQVKYGINRFSSLYLLAELI